ncbi:MAG: hypothetical protein ABSH27_05655 [Solirubrobacteraceae bacterium]
MQFCQLRANLQNSRATPRHEKENKIMPTAETHTNPVVPDFEAAAERAREANDRLAEAGRKVTTAYLDSVEKYVAGLAKFERKVAEQSQVEVVASLLDTHAKLTEEVVKASVSAARELITANAS